ncbi:MAG: trypsin-like peptidase domain-containing protein [Clostridia bacterium]|nr:trypsin-like peptidase domain-containing protein [Clostridia bacterium]
MKKIIAIFLIMTIFCLSASHASAESTLSKNVANFEIETFTVASLNTKNGTVSYKNYDTSITTAAKQAGITQLATPASVGADAEIDTFIENNNTIAPRNIINGDNRVRITNPQSAFPYKAICQIITYWDKNGDGIYDEKVGIASGYMAGPSIVVTNGHVIYDDEKKIWCEYAEVIPARDGANSQPFGIIESTTIHTSTAWIEDADFDHDWAIIELETPVGKETGWFSQVWTSGTLNNTSVNLTGYPGDKDFGTMWRAPGSIVNTFDYWVEFSCDTYRGSSGAPIYNSNNQIVAINSAEGGEYNGGVRITEWLYNYLNSFNPAGPGSLDSVNSSRIAGWAVNDNNYMADCEVHLYIRKASDNSLVKGVSGVIANNYREDVGFRCFSYPINWVTYVPMQYKIEAFAIYGNNPALTNSPRYFTVRPASGIVDVVTSNQIAGWAWKPDAPNSSIQVHIYIRRSNGDVVTIYPVSAGNYRSDLESLGMGNGKHGYVYPINWSALPKENLTVEVYAVDGSGHHPRIYVGTYNNAN